MQKSVYNAAEAARAVGVSKPTMLKYLSEGLVQSNSLRFPTGAVRHRISRAELERVFGVDLSEASEAQGIE